MPHYILIFLAWETKDDFNFDPVCNLSLCTVVYQVIFSKLLWKFSLECKLQNIVNFTQNLTCIVCLQCIYMYFNDVFKNKVLPYHHIDTVYNVFTLNQSLPNFNIVFTSADTTQSFWHLYAQTFHYSGNKQTWWNHLQFTWSRSQSNLCLRRGIRI